MELDLTVSVIDDGSGLPHAPKFESDTGTIMTYVTSNIIAMDLLYAEKLIDKISFSFGFNIFLRWTEQLLVPVPTCYTHSPLCCYNKNMEKH